MTDTNDGQEKRIEIEWNGPYHVDGDIPLVRKTQIVSEYGEPIAWQTEETLRMPDIMNCAVVGIQKINRIAIAVTWKSILTAPKPRQPSQPPNIG